MTTATAPDYALPALGGRYYFLLRRLHSLTGIVFGGYLIVHLLINATIAQGGRVYQTQVQKIHDLPLLPVIEWTFIYLPILFHTVYGIWITFTGQPNVDRYPYVRNWGYVAQRVSAILIAVFMLFHILSLKYGLFGTNLSFDPHHALATVGRHFDHWWAVILIYPIFILASCYHLAYGFWQAAITWGLTISSAAQRRWGMACAGLFVLTFVAGMIALIAGAKLDWEKLPVRPEVAHGS